MNKSAFYVECYHYFILQWKISVAVPLCAMQWEHEAHNYNKNRHNLKIVWVLMKVVLFIQYIAKQILFNF